MSQNGRHLGSHLGVAAGVEVEADKDDAFLVVLEVVDDSLEILYLGLRGVTVFQPLFEFLLVFFERAFPDLAQILDGVESASGRIGDVEVQLIVVHRAHPDQNEGQELDDRAVNLKPEWRYLFQEIHFDQTLRCLKPLKKNSRLPMMISKMAKV